MEEEEERRDEEEEGRDEAASRYVPPSVEATGNPNGFV
jgi:hypothetical protein